MAPAWRIQIRLASLGFVERLRLKYQAKANFERLKRYLVEDTVSYDESELFSDYESYIWSGVATRVGTSVSPGYLTYSLS